MQAVGCAATLLLLRRNSCKLLDVQGASCIGDRGETAVRVEPFTSRGERSLDEWERLETLERMYKHGMEKVRGWMYKTLVMSPMQRDDAAQQICAYKRLCGKCGRVGHFAVACFASTKAAWLSS